MSRELDIEVAKTVFGVKRVYCRYGQPWDEATAEHETDRPFYISSGKPWRTHSIDAIPVPRYSTDVAAAMTVFEAMVEMTGSGSISADMEDARGEGFIVGVSFGFDDEDGGSAMGPLPEAVCRAALDALSGHQRPNAGDAAQTSTLGAGGAEWGAL